MMHYFDCMRCGDEYNGYYPQYDFVCEDCSQCCGYRVVSQAAFERHREVHHDWCKSCDRFFNSAHALAQHLKSSVHQPKIFGCPKCPRNFVSTSSVIAHLESGTCPSRITRAIIDAYVARKDVNNLITNPNRMITNGSSNAKRTLQPITRYVATDQAWNGDAWECCLCNCDFLYRAQLEQHLNSPKHAKRPGKLYRCPAAACRIELETLSGLVQHVESGKCGIRTNRAVQDTMKYWTADMRQMRLTC